MISEGSRDTKDCSNDAENSDLHHRNKLIIILLCYFKLIIFHTITVFTVFLIKYHSTGEHVRYIYKTILNISLLIMNSFYQFISLLLITGYADSFIKIIIDDQYLLKTAFALILLA